MNNYMLKSLVESRLAGLTKVLEAGSYEPGEAFWKDLIEEVKELARYVEKNYVDFQVTSQRIQRKRTKG
jgi:hypothetical protein